LAHALGRHEAEERKPRSGKIGPADSAARPRYGLAGRGVQLRRKPFGHHRGHGHGRAGRRSIARCSRTHAGRRCAGRHVDRAVHGFVRRRLRGGPRRLFFVAGRPGKEGPDSWRRGRLRGACRNHCALSLGLRGRKCLAAGGLRASTSAERAARSGPARPAHALNHGPACRLARAGGSAGAAEGGRAAYAERPVGAGSRPWRAG